MRWYIIRALVAKEFYRHLANRGGIALSVLMVVAALLLSVFHPGGRGGEGGGTSMVGGIHHCYVEYAEDAPEAQPVIDHLIARVPPELKNQVVFKPRRPESIGELIQYAPGVGAIHVRVQGDDGSGRPALAFQVWHPAGDPTAMAPYEGWFWKETRAAVQAEAVRRLREAGADPGKLPRPEFGTDDLWAVRESFRALDEQAEAARKAATRATAGGPLLPAIGIERRGLGGKVLDLRTAIATGMVMFALYFFCVYLLPTMTCEERERGVLLAQALSPASPAEILTAKFLFYPAAGVGLAAVIAAISNPALASSLFFWLSLVAVSSGFLGIGMTVATLAKTQRAAFMGGMCYLMSVSMGLLICQQNGIPFVSHLAVEYHGPRILHAAISGEVQAHHWLHLIAAATLAFGWVMAAGWLFRRRGWQ